MELLRVEEEGRQGDDGEHLLPSSKETSRTCHKVARWGVPLVMCGFLASAGWCWRLGQGAQKTVDSDGFTELQEGSDFSINAAEAMQSVPPSFPPKTVLYRSRQQDYAQSLAERFAGLFGAAFFAISTGRELKIDWPEIEEIFDEKLLQWRYDPLTLQISPMDQASLNLGKFPSQAGDQTFSGLSGKVMVLDANVRSDIDRVSSLWRGQPSEFGNATHATPVVVLGSNRGGAVDWYHKFRQSHKIPNNCGYWDLYRGIYNALFTLRGDFVSSNVSMRSMNGGLDPPRPLQHYLQLLTSPGTYSLGIHITASERVKNAESQGDGSPEMCSHLIPQDQLAHNFWCIEHLASIGRSDFNRILVLFTDSHCVRVQMMEHFKRTGLFTEVWTQEVAPSADDGWKQIMFDWALMRQVYMTGVDGFVNDFTSSALITTDARKPLYELSQCKELKKDVLCQSMFC